ISSVLLFTEGLLLHVSRGIRWDSDHVVILGDEVQAIANELVAGDYLGRVFIGLDFFDASINRIAAWVIGMRAMLKALLAALLTPWDHLREFEDSMNYTGRLVLMEAVKTLPMSAVWDYYCLKHDVPLDDAFLSDILRYENEVLSKRGH
ncbi:MAG TPA: L-rhamnose isomerase, partial [Thermogutta sp.]|nr:L-rhamnose isomerase [Thermogutta sp.]